MSAFDEMGSGASLEAPARVAGAPRRGATTRILGNRDRLEIDWIRKLVWLSANNSRENGFSADDVYELVILLEERICARRWTLKLKRVFDVMGAGFGLFIAAPLLLLIAIAVRLTSPGPAIYSQPRHGVGQRQFQIYKFRTMYQEASDPSGVAQACHRDPRVTPLGRLLRRANLDEFPQLWNVLKGDMSFVGPRPHPVDMRANGQRYDELVLVYPLRHMIKPGITGLAQMRGFRGATIDPTAARLRIVCDLVYATRFSLLLDLKIVFLTLLHEYGGRAGTGS